MAKENLRRKNHKHKRLRLRTICASSIAMHQPACWEKKNKEPLNKIHSRYNLRIEQNKRKNTHSYTLCNTHAKNTQIDHHRLRDLEFSCLFIGRRSSSDRDREPPPSSLATQSTSEWRRAGSKDQHPRRENEFVCLSVLS